MFPLQKPDKQELQGRILVSLRIQNQAKQKKMYTKALKHFTAITASQKLMQITQV